MLKVQRATSATAKLKTQRRTQGARGRARASSVRSLTGQRVPGAAARPPRRHQRVAAVGNEAQDQEDPKSPDETTRKYGLEAGLWQVLSSKDEDPNKKRTSAKDLLARYGSAYLLTSISLSIVSFTFFYVLVSNGVDVAALLKNVGIEVSSKGEAAGTAALAYVAHKAASPIRFPPTVALTPVVAKALGKEGENDGADNTDSDATDVTAK